MVCGKSQFHNNLAREHVVFFFLFVLVKMKSGNMSDAGVTPLKESNLEMVQCSFSWVVYDTLKAQLVTHCCFDYK